MCCTKISIIGAGLSSVLTALALSRENQHLEIEIYEKEKALLLKGLAYSSSLPYQPLNVIASKMSILPDIDTHFVDWLYDYYQHTQTKEALSQTFQPRNIFAIYLEQTFKELLPNIKIVEDEVIDIEVVGEHKILKLKSGTQVQTDFIVLATGNADSLPLKNVANYQGLVINRLADVNIQSMKDTKHLLIVGSGLSAIDIIGSLYTLNYQGKIDLISRRGLLPAAHKPTHKQAHHLDIDISDLILNARPSIYDYFRFFRAKIKEHRNFPWQDIIDAVREYTPQLWDNLPETDKIIFLRRLKPFWEIHRHRMPIASFDIIQKMKNDGRLNVFKSEITASENQRITLSNHTVIEPDAIINCTGQNTDIDSQSILLANLHQKGIFIADNLKLGILTTPEGEVVSRQNAATNIFTIGALRKAKEYECIAARELKIQATALSKSIQKRILLNDLEGILNFDDFTKKAFTYDLNVYKHFLPPAAFVPDTYTRTLVYQKKYTIFLLVWGGKAVTDIHDHAASTAKIKVLQGKIKEQKYSVGNGFNIDCEMIYGAGDTFGESPNDIHRVTNSSNDFSISLHIYNTDSPTLDGVRIFDSENRKVGYLNSSAKSSTWNQPPSAFDKVISF